MPDRRAFLARLGFGTVAAAAAALTFDVEKWLWTPGDRRSSVRLMPDLTCPVCFNTEAPAAESGPLRVCGYCGATVVIGDDGVPRRATHADVEPLSAAEFARLRHVRVQRTGTAR